MTGEVYKSAKLIANDDQRHTDGRTDNGNERGDSNTEAGPSLAPEEEGDYGPEAPPDDDDDDDEGRFFGGGITEKESEVLDFLRATDGNQGPDHIDAVWLRKMILNFEKRITKNAELRAKFEDQPQRFIESEGDLDADIKGLSILSEHTQLYPELVKLGAVDSLVGLLAHENTDIAIDAIEVIGELTDEDVSSEEEHWNALAEALMSADVPGLLVSNLTRLQEDDESDRNGVYYTLGVFENLCSRATYATRLGKDDKLCKWLLGRIKRKEPAVSQNKQYAAELLAIIAQASLENRQKLSSLDAVDVILQLLAPYRKRDAERGSEEEEYMGDLFEALTCLVDEIGGKTKFIEAEGVELCLIMLKEGKMSKIPALRLLDHATGGPSRDICIKLVEAGGLKGLFTLFNKTKDRRLLEHILSVLASLLRHLPSDSAERLRTLAKFVEKDYEKTSKLVHLRRDYTSRIATAENGNTSNGKDLTLEDREMLEVERLSRRLDAGLYTLQLIDGLLAWLVAEDEGARRKIKQLLGERDEDLKVLRVTILEQIGGLDTGQQENWELKDMLDTLLKFLR